MNQQVTAANPFTPEEAQKVFLEDDIMGEIAAQQVDTKQVNVRFFYAVVKVNNATPGAMDPKGDVIINGPQNRLHIEIAPIADPSFSLVREATELDKRMYPRAYAAYTATGDDGFDHGDQTPLSNLPGISKQEVDLFSLSRIFTIEQAADLPENTRRTLGLMGDRVCKMASLWVQRRDDSDLGSVADRLAALERKNEALTANNTRMQQELGAREMALRVLNQTAGAAAPSGGQEVGAGGRMLESDQLGRVEPGQLQVEGIDDDDGMFGAVDDGGAEDDDMNVEVPTT